ncbi:MAG TPA: N-acetylmuramoyl-L-alanine amidase, partial [Roseiflexaceae bacterium]|nr:N-acetylmuramoyl-L-alanine amidase [Roseiflexaceae bacterium]
MIRYWIIALLAVPLALAPDSLQQATGPVLNSALEQAEPTATANPTPTPRPEGTPMRVGIQAGHWNSRDLPDEQARLRTSAGAFAAGYAEWQINLDIARRVEKLLIAEGVAVDVLPATVPPSYDADAFVALHADGSRSTASRGYKLATPWRTSRASADLMAALDTEYGALTRLPRDGAVTVNMRGYYAFNYRRHTHAIAATTPAVILEMGFLTNPSDRAFMVNQADRVAQAIANGVLRYLRERDPSDGAALMPPEYPIQRPISADGLVVRAAPRDNARVLGRAPGDARMVVFSERDGWYEIAVRGEWRLI